MTIYDVPRNHKKNIYSISMIPCITAQLGQPFHGWPSFKDVTVPRVAIFRDAIVDLFDMELGTRHVYRWILHNLISEIPIYLCYKIVIIPSCKRMLSACSRRVRKGSEERKCPAYLKAQRVFFKLEWLMFVMFPRFCLLCLRILECVKEIRTNQLMPRKPSCLLFFFMNILLIWCIFCWEIINLPGLSSWDCDAWRWRPHRFTSKMRAGLSAIMNYVGGAIIYIRPLTASLRSACREGEKTYRLIRGEFEN